MALAPSITIVGRYWKGPLTMGSLIVKMPCLSWTMEVSTRVQSRTLRPMDTEYSNQRDLRTKGVGLRTDHMDLGRRLNKTKISTKASLSKAKDTETAN